MYMRVRVRVIIAYSKDLQSSKKVIYADSSCLIIWFRTIHAGSGGYVGFPTEDAEFKGSQRCLQATKILDADLRNLSNSFQIVMMIQYLIEQQS